jgi:ORF6N domain
MFQLTAEESDSLRSHFVALKIGRGRHRKYLPFAFNEQGIAMLSSVLRSKRAVQVREQECGSKKSKKQDPTWRPSWNPMDPDFLPLAETSSALYSNKAELGTVALA